MPCSQGCEGIVPGGLHTLIHESTGSKFQTEPKYLHPCRQKKAAIEAAF